MKEQRRPEQQRSLREVIVSHPMASIFSKEKPRVAEFFMEDVSFALSKVVSSSENSELMARFYQAYEHRSQFPWLVESGKVPGRDKDGLIGAFKHAFASYSSGYEPREDFEDQQFFPPSTKKKRKLQEAAKVATEDHIPLASFAMSLHYGIVDFRSTEMIEVHVRNALVNYCERQDSGTTTDPW